MTSFKEAQVIQIFLNLKINLHGFTNRNLHWNCAFHSHKHTVELKQDVAFVLTSWCFDNIMAG